MIYNDIFNISNICDDVMVWEVCLYQMIKHFIVHHQFIGNFFFFDQSKSYGLKKAHLVPIAQGGHHQFNCG